MLAGSTPLFCESQFSLSNCSNDFLLFIVYIYNSIFDTPPSYYSSFKFSLCLDCFNFFFSLALGMFLLNFLAFPLSSCHLYLSSVSLILLCVCPSLSFNSNLSLIQFIAYGACAAQKTM